MNNRLGSFKNQKNIEQQEIHSKQPIDIDKIEVLICIESLLAVCCQTLAAQMHHQAARQECQQFEQRAQYHQQELRKIFPISEKSEVAIENRIYKYLLQLNPSHLPLKAVMNLDINLTALAIDIYKHFSRTFQEHHGLLKNFLEDNVEEMDFLCQEKQLHQNRLDTY